MPPKQSSKPASKSSLESADQLLGLAGRIADTLAIHREEFGTALETTLRASLTSAIFACRGYHALLDASERSQIAIDFIGDSKAQCERALNKLREHVAESLGLVCSTVQSEQFANLILGFAS